MFAVLNLDKYTLNFNETILYQVETHVYSTAVRFVHLSIMVL